jgi:hypothetical protein
MRHHAQVAADMLGNLLAQTATSRHAELGVLHPVTRAAQRPINARICRIEDVALAHAYAQVSMIIRCGDNAEVSGQALDRSPRGGLPNICVS